MISGEMYIINSLKFAKYYLAGIYLLKVNNRNTRARCEICSKLTIDWFFIVNSDHISHLFLVFLLLTLSR